MVVLPSREWAEKVVERANSSERFTELVKDWEGDFLLIVEFDEQFLRSLRKKETLEGLMSLWDMLPMGDRKLFKGTPLGDFFERKLGIPLDAPVGEIDVKGVMERSSKLSPEDMKGVSANMWLDPHRGKIRNFTMVAPSQHEDAAFTLRGPYKDWEIEARGLEATLEEFPADWFGILAKLRITGDYDYLVSHWEAVKEFAKVLASAMRG